MELIRFKKENFVPSLRGKLESKGMPAEYPTIALPLTEYKQLNIGDRHHLFVSEAKQIVEWEASSLRELFRGDVKPPVMGSYPPVEYNLYFYYIESQIITACMVIGDRTDGEFLEIYSNLRRHPDGKSLGLLHDFLWQVCALLLAVQPLTALQFEAIIGRLATSARTFSIGLGSRNYIHYVRETVGSIR